MCFNSKATPTNNTDYICYHNIKELETHAHIQTYMHTHNTHIY